MTPLSSPLQIKNRLLDIFDSKPDRGQSHGTQVQAEMALLDKEISDLEGGWDSVSCVRVVGKNHSVEDSEMTEDDGDS